MRFEWDENKRLLNVRDHEVDFIDMVQIFDGRPTFTYHSPRQNEDRWGTVGIVNSKFYLVVWTERGDRRRINSAYRADDWEIREYRQLYG
ncbi:MAG: BrnT family toxin [Geminicoccaceae bacterium]